MPFFESTITRDMHRRLNAALTAVDDWHAEAVRALPDASWHQLNELEIERCKRSSAVYEAFDNEKTTLAHQIATEDED